MQRSFANVELRNGHVDKTAILRGRCNVYFTGLIFQTLNSYSHNVLGKKIFYEQIRKRTTACPLSLYIVFNLICLSFFQNNT